MALGWKQGGLGGGGALAGAAPGGALLPSLAFMKLDVALHSSSCVL